MTDAHDLPDDSAADRARATPGDAPAGDVESDEPTRVADPDLSSDDEDEEVDQR